MSGEEGQKVVWLRITDEHWVEAFYADFPKDSTVKELNIKGPIKIDGGGWAPNNAGVPVFDADKDEILWPVPKVDQFKPKNTDPKVLVWRIGQHFEFQEANETVVTCDAGGEPSVLLHEGLLSVCSRMIDESRAKEGEDMKWQPMIAIKGLDSQDPNKWMNATLNTVGYYLQAAQTTLMSGGKHQLKMKYVYLLRTSSDFLQSQQIYIASIKAANYKEIPKNSALTWNRLNVNTDGTFEREVRIGPEPEDPYEDDERPTEYRVQNVNRGVAHVITHDKRSEGGTGKHYINLFHPVDEMNAIQVMSVPLREDGSFDTYDTKITPGLLKVYLGDDDAFTKCTALRAHLSNNLILFTWLDKSNKMCAATTPVKEDGTLELFKPGSKWASGVDVAIKWEKQPSEAAKSWPMLGVVVPSDYV